MDWRGWWQQFGMLSMSITAKSIPWWWKTTRRFVDCDLPGSMWDRSCQNGKILKVWELGDVESLKKQLADDQTENHNGDF
jgi:hypothetical protein